VAGLVPAEDCFVPGDLAATCAEEDLLVEAGFCCATASLNAAKQIMIPIKVTNFFTNLMFWAFVAGLCLKFVPIVNHEVDVSDYLALTGF
jgi:hypothetical protein